MLLGVQPDQEAGHVDDLLADADVTLADEDASVMDGLGKSELEDLGLETTLQEIFDLQTEDEIELHALLVQDADPDQTPEKCVAFEQPAGFLLVQGKKFTGSLTDVGKHQFDPPYFTLVSEAELTDKLQLLIETSLLERTSWGREDLGTVLLNASVYHLGLSVVLERC